MSGWSACSARASAKTSSWSGGGFRFAAQAGPWSFRCGLRPGGSTGGGGLGDAARPSELGDAALLETLELWLQPYLAGIRKLGDLTAVALEPALRAQLSHAQVRELDALAPARLRVPSGSNLLLDYQADGGSPVLAVRLQEMLGCAQTPKVAGGELPISLHLLSPARRPIQVTQDLVGFWSGSYAEVRKEMRGRYPRHPWPEDPLSAAPTRKAKPRKP